MQPPIFIQIDENPNCAAMDGQVFQPKSSPRPVNRVRVTHNGAAAWCDIVALDDSGATAPAVASLVDDSGDGHCYLVSGGTWGLRLSNDEDQFGEPYLLLGADGDDLEFAATA
ncbi:MAG TPA: hypothetical protein VHW24_08990 [Bryobacteraceae bacterium]|jgi:hypothetical protein|nr:hypothetical protein [Bryobacteraceae bacterium]